MALYIFQFGFLQPISSIINSQFFIGVFTIILVTLALVLNRFQIKKSVGILFLIVGIYFLSNSLIYNSNLDIIISIYFEFILKGFSGLIIGSLDTEYDTLYEAFFKIAIINFIIIAPYPFVSFLSSMNYMRFGYAMIPSTIMFLFATFDKERKKIICGLLFLISFYLTFVYGSRGPIVVILVLGLLVFLFDKRYNFKKRNIIIFLSISIAFVFLKYNVPGKFLNYLYFDLGIKNYSVMKFQRMFNGQFLAATSGRDRIYKESWKIIKSNFIFGHGVGFIETSINKKAHNVFLQILSESGVIGLMVWGLLAIICAKKYINAMKYDSVTFIKISNLLISVSLGRLLVSSDIWLRPEFWFTVSLLLGYKKQVDIGYIDNNGMRVKC